MNLLFPTKNITLNLGDTITFDQVSGKLSADRIEGDFDGKNVTFDNTGTDLESTKTEDAIKEVNDKVNHLPSVDAYTKEQSDEKYATKTELSNKADVSAIPTKTSQLQNDSGFTQIDDTQASASKTYSSEKINNDLNTKASIDSANDYMLDTFNQCNYGINRSLVNMLTDGYLTVSNELHAQTANKEKTTGFISVISGHYYNFLYNYVTDGWFRICQYDSNKNFLGVFDKNNIGEYRFFPTTEAYIRVSFRTFGNENVLSITDMIPQALTNSLGVTEYEGYIGSTGIFTRPTVAKEVYTGYYTLSEDLALNLTVFTKDKSERILWCCYATYDENFAFISRTTIRTDSQPKLEILEYALSQSDINTLISGGAKYIAFTYRTYGVATSVITANYKKPFVEQKMSDLLCRKVLNIESLMPDVLRLNVVDVNKNIKSINHRGFNTAPENTLPAFKLSRQNGFAYVETDIRFTSDNVPVLLHDASINRTARNADGTAISGTVNIADITYAQALTYDFGVYKNASYAGTKIPTLEQFMALCRNIGLHPYLELRNDVNYTAEQYGIVYETVRNSGMLNNVSWISHGKAKLEEVLSRKPNSRVGLLTDTLATGNITTVNEIKTSYPNADVFLNADYSTLNSTNLAYAVNNEIPLEVWTVNTDNAILGLDTYISGVTSDSKVAGNVTYNHDLT